MRRILDGVRSFQQDVFPEMAEMFGELAGGQQPDTLLITCCDSRIDPNLITQTHPGELFVVRNAGNIVPPYTGDGGGEAAAIELAVAALGVKDIIVCGHSDCGAMSCLFDGPDSSERPAIAAWLRHAERSYHALETSIAGREDENPLDVLIEQNVLVQLDHLRTHPAVIDALGRRKLRLHGWIYRIATGEILECGE
jgi:carbonic anhydrase